nr:hypothetical protein [Tanacetum cinerariifolium]
GITTANLSSPIPAFNLDDDDFDPLWGSASQPSQYTKGPSEPIEEDSLVEEVAAVKQKRKYTRRPDSEDVEVRPMGRDIAKKKGSLSGARSESSVAGDPRLVDAL